MSLFNFHTHTQYCDGESTAEQMVLSAIEQKLDILGFSTHAPVPFATEWNMKFEKISSYFAEIHTLKDKYKNDITIYTGLEADYIENLQSIEQMRFPQTDFIIGGVHFLGYLPSGRAWECDHSTAFFEQGLHEIFENKITKMHKQFFSATNALILQKPDILAHIDLLKKFNRGGKYFDEYATGYRNLLCESVELAAQNEVIIEINTRGFYKGDFPSFYPDADTVKFGKTKGALFTISSDSHRAGEFRSGVREAAEMLTACGISNIYFKIKGQPVEVALSEYMNKLNA